MLKSYTFDDISLLPGKRSDIKSRRDVDISSQIAPGIRLNIPFIPSYMPNVSEEQMAIAAARLGGMACLHRWNTIEQQVEMVLKVKRAESKVIKDPYTITPNMRVEKVQEELKRLGVGTLIVVDSKKNKKVLGVISTRDVDLREDSNLQAKDVMTPRENLVCGQVGITVAEATRLFVEHRLENVPVVDAKGKLHGLVSKKDIKKLKNRLASRDNEGRLLVAAAIGLRANDVNERLAALVAAEVDMVFLAVANGYLGEVLDTVENIKSNYPDMPLAAGTVAEHNGAKMLFDAGADTALVGIGPGSICRTRVVAGVGIGQFTALRLAQEATREGKFIVSDGGVHQPHHFNKALLAGAHATILGSALAGTDESPGEVHKVNGVLVKDQMGLASNRAGVKFDEVHGIERKIDKNDLEEYVHRHVASEGVEEAFVPYRGSVVERVREIIGGLRSAMTYMDSRNLDEFRNVCDNGAHCGCERNHYMIVSDAAQKEGQPHDLLSFRT